jgi:predicted HicB family RNase H-like nuclease
MWYACPVVTHGRAFAPQIAGVQRIGMVSIQQTHDFDLQCQRCNTENGRCIMSMMSMRLPDELSNQLDIMAAATGRTKSFLAGQAIRDYIERNG